MGKTLFEKIWTKHLVRELPDGAFLLYIDRHLVHEVTSPRPSRACDWREEKSAHPNWLSPPWITMSPPPKIA